MQLRRVFESAGSDHHGPDGVVELHFRRGRHVFVAVELGTVVGDDRRRRANNDVDRPAGDHATHHSARHHGDALGRE